MAQVFASDVFNSAIFDAGTAPVSDIIAAFRARYPDFAAVPDSTVA